MTGPEAMDAIFRFIIDYKSRHDGRSPSHRQILKACQISSTSLVNYYLGGLAKQGKIALESGSRNIRVVGGEWRLLN